MQKKKIKGGGAEEHSKKILYVVQKLREGSDWLLMRGHVYNCGQSLEAPLVLSRNIMSECVSEWMSDR